MGLFGKKKGAAEAGQEQKDAGSANSSPVFQDQKSRLESELSAMTEITLKLTDNVLSFSPTATWELTENEAIVARNRISELEKEVEEATRKGMKWKAEVEDVKKQLNVHKFKHSILLDMLAVSQADATASSAKLEKERIRVDQYRKEVERAYALCVEHGVNIEKETLTSE